MVLLLLFDSVLHSFYCCHVLKLFLSFVYSSLSTKLQPLIPRVQWTEVDQIWDNFGKNRAINWLYKFGLDFR